MCGVEVRKSVQYTMTHTVCVICIEIRPVVAFPFSVGIGHYHSWEFGNEKGRDSRVPGKQVPRSNNPNRDSVTVTTQTGLLACFAYLEACFSPVFGISSCVVSDSFNIFWSFFQIISGFRRTRRGKLDTVAFQQIRLWRADLLQSKWQKSYECYKSLVRCHLKYANSVRNPYKQGLINDL